MLRSGCDIGVFQIGLFYQISKNDIVFCISRNNNPYPPAVFEILLDCFPQISYYVHLLENIRVRFVSSLFHCKCIESLHKKQQKINILQHNYPPPLEGEVSCSRCLSPIRFTYTTSRPRPCRWKSGWRLTSESRFYRRFGHASPGGYA